MSVKRRERGPRRRRAWYNAVTMSSIGQDLLAFLATGQSSVGLAVLFAAAAVEYVFPPFPGDTVTLFGAFLAAHSGWSVPLVFAAVTGGSLAGAAFDYAIGRRLGARDARELTGRLAAARARVEPVLERFARHGSIYIALNRFLPGIRALFFVAAGMARLPLGTVLLWGGVSAAAWNALVIAAGFAIGKSWQGLLDLLHTYTLAAWIAVGALIVGAVIAALRRR